MISIHFTSAPFQQDLNWNPGLFESLDLLPESWRKTLITSDHIFRGAEIQWLEIKAHPFLSDQELKSIHRSIAVDAWWVSNDQQAVMKSLITQATWLDDSVRSELARWVVIRSSRDLTKLEPWIDQLPPAIRKKPLKSYQYFYGEKVKMREESANKDLDARFIKYSEELLGKILDSYDSQRDVSMNSWTEPEIKKFQAKVRDLTREQAFVLSTRVDLVKLPWRIRASLIPKCFENELSNRNPVLLQSTRTTAKAFATYDPAMAATWANTTSPPSKKSPSKPTPPPSPPAPPNATKNSASPSAANPSS